MSLTLPTAYSNSSKLSNIQENWIVQLGFFNGDAQGSGEGGWDATLQADGTANLLNEALDDSETPVDVDDGTVFQVGDYIKVESEIMKVKSISTNTITVDRGAMSTTAATHNNNTAIYWNNFTPISLTDTTVDDVFYHGTITNHSVSIRSSINLASSTAKTGNVSLSVINFQFKGDDFSAELFLGTRKYINRDVKIYSQLNGDTTLANCLQIYQGRLIDISHDDSSLSLTLTEQRPWDFITFPQIKTSVSKKYIPAVYGEFTENTSTPSSQNLCDGRALYPSPVDNVSGHILSIVPRTYNGTTYQDGRLHHYEKDSDQFVPIDDSGFTDSSESYQGGNAIRCKIDLQRGFKTKPRTSLSTTNFSNTDNSFDLRTDDASTYSSVSSTLGPLSGETLTATNKNIVSAPNLIGKITELKLFIRYKFEYTNFNETSASALSFDAPYSDAITGSSSASVRTYTSGDLLTAYTNNSNQIPNIGVKAFHSVEYDGSGTDDTLSCRIYDIQLLVKIALHQSGDPEGSKNYLDGLELMYVGANGNTESWSGSDAEISYGHEAHRDMLIRYAGYTTTAPANWSALNTDRAIATWKIRWWELEPVELKKVLEQLQYEFGFIFKFRADGTGSYIYILQTSELSATQTFKKDDIANLKINNSSFSDLLTKMEINYEKHPAENRYLSSVTSSNSTARTNWNIQAKENIKEANLDMNVGTPNTSGQTDGNADFYSYYDNIFGDIKKIISCDIVNSAKGYSLETGDIVQFSNTAGEMPVEPFGDNWADFYMITDLNRSLGKVSITAREVG